MQHYRPFEKPWYDGRSIGNNPLRTLNPSNGLERRVDTVHVDNEYPINNQSSLLDYARRVAGKILSVMPTPVRYGIVTVSLVSLLSLGTACDNPATSTPPPKKQEQTTTQTSTIAVESTYRVIFPYKEPSSSLEEKVYNNTDVVTYMKFVRKKEDVKWAISLADLVNQSWNPIQWKDFIEKTISNELTPYVPLEDISTFQQSQPNYQGTLNVDSSGKPIIAEPRYFQETATREFIPIQEPDMVKQVFEELKANFSAEEKTYGQSKIAFESLRDSSKVKNYEIYVINPDRSGLERLTNNPAGDYNPSWSPDGKKIAFMSDRDRNWEIYVMNADGSGAINLTNNPALDSGKPAWSPNGKKIAFISKRDGNLEIYVMNTDGSGQINLTNNPASDFSPAWSPNGKKIAFISERDGNLEIYVMNTDGSGQINLTNSPSYYRDINWSPNGKKIAFISKRDGNLEIYVMNTDGSGQINLTNNPASDFSPAWSPNGKKIVFQSLRNGNWDIYVMNPDGSGLERLTNDSLLNHQSPDWSPDGEKIVFMSQGEGFGADHDIFVMNADGSGLERLTYNSATDAYPSWSPFLSK